LDKLLRAQRNFSPEARQAAKEALYALSLWRKRLDYHAAPDLGPSAQLFVLLRDLAEVPEELARSLSGYALPLPRKEAPQDFATRHALPDWIAALLQQHEPQHAEGLARALNLPGPITLRANTLRQSREELAQTLRAEGIETIPTRHAPHGLHISSPRPNLYASPSYRNGDFEVQDEGSQLLAWLCEASPGQTIVDYCAGAGGKSLSLAADLHNQGVLYCYDLNPERLQRLEARRLRAGVTCIRLLSSGEEVCADTVLVDAPCSELGALRRGPDARYRITPRLVEEMRQRQAEILRRAALLVRPGGLLVYATCSLHPDENQGVIETFLRERDEFSLGPLPKNLSRDFARGHFFQAQPYPHHTDGFFAARLFKRPARYITAPTNTQRGTEGALGAAPSPRQSTRRDHGTARKARQSTKPRPVLRRILGFALRLSKLAPAFLADRAARGEPAPLCLSRAPRRHGRPLGSKG
jgi:16S rRNA (cytosine967-C5)-methyltransferase